MSHKNIVAVLVVHDKNVFVGKHSDGPFKGKWGVASIDSSIDTRPTRVAARLMETCLLGMLGTRNTVFGLQKLSSSVLGLQLFQFDTDVPDLPQFVSNVCAYVLSCFAKGSTVPPGLVPWTACRWLSPEEKLSGFDPIATDAITHFRSLQALNSNSLS